ncbi:MAG: pilus assembly protein, partial [Beijerinckiaceae bacterium]|nr:pilus assembly protein [Beijerinckiaceae bacterium]
EFALIGPVMLFFMLATFVLGIEYNNFIIITNAAQAGTFQLTVSRGTTSTPYTKTVDAAKDAAPGLTSPLPTISMDVNGVACTSDTSCKALLDLPTAQGSPASVTVSYPCAFTFLQVANFVMTIPACPRTTKTIGRIQ